MTWATLIPIIIQNGLPVAEAIWKKVESGQAPTQADWDELRALAKQDATNRMTQQLLAAGIPLDDPKAIALLNLTR